MEDNHRYEELMEMDKEHLVRLFLKSERIRKGQVDRLISQEKELDKYEDISFHDVIDSFLGLEDRSGGMKAAIKKNTIRELIETIETEIEESKPTMFRARIDKYFPANLDAVKEWFGYYKEVLKERYKI